MRLAAPISAGALLAAILLVAAAPPVTAQQETSQEILESQRRLESLRRQRGALADEMTRIRSRVTDLSEELENVERQVTSSAAAIQEVDFQIARWEEKIAVNNAELDTTRAQLAVRREVVNHRLRSIYKRGHLRTLQVLLAAESFSDLLNRYRYLDRVARTDRRLMEEVEQLETLLLTRERTLRGNIRELERARDAQEQEHLELAGLQEQQKAVLSRARSQEATTAERIASIERDEAALATMVAGIEARRTEHADSPRSDEPVGATGAYASFASLRGRLDWPVDGPILYRFDSTASASPTIPERSGLGIGGPRGAAVRSVAAGTVALAGSFEGYGPTVIISHGAGYYTLYLYLREVTVRSGAAVGAGETIGLLGGGPSAEAPHLEFQIRTPEGRVDDPLAWLRPQ